MVVRWKHKNYKTASSSAQKPGKTGKTCNRLVKRVGKGPWGEEKVKKPKTGEGGEKRSNSLKYYELCTKRGGAMKRGSRQGSRREGGGLLQSSGGERKRGGLTEILERLTNGIKLRSGKGDEGKMRMAPNRSVRDGNFRENKSARP